MDGSQKVNQISNAKHVMKKIRPSPSSLYAFNEPVVLGKFRFGGPSERETVWFRLIREAKRGPEIAIIDEKANDNYEIKLGI